MTAPPIQPGDAFLLFFPNFPYGFNEVLPLAVSPNVYLDATPQDVRTVTPELDSLLTRYDYHSLVYDKLCSDLDAYCLRSPVAKESSQRFFLSIAALRLRVPLIIKIACKFELSKDKVNKSLALYNLKSPWQLETDAQYSAEDIRLSAKIAERQLELYNSDYKRIISAMVLFSQVTCGFSKSFQMAYLALFAALEALFVSKEEYAKAKPLARRAANFLSSFKSQFSAPLKDWLEEEYKCGRNKLVHGVQDVVPWSKELSEEKRLVFGQLHEIARLSILGFMSDNTKLESLSRNTGKQLQKELDSLSPATGQFLNGQRVWCT